MRSRDQVIRTVRLDLVIMPPDLMRAVLAGEWELAGRLLGAQIPGEWRAESWGWLRHHLVRADDPAAVVWGPRLLLLRPRPGSGDPPTVVGEAGLHGPPDTEGLVEFGYMVVTGHRRQGYAGEAVRGLLGWAGSAGVGRFRACVSPGNAVSRGLLAALGFTQVGVEEHPERGEELVFERTGPVDAQPSGQTTSVRSPSAPDRPGPTG